MKIEATRLFLLASLGPECRACLLTYLCWLIIFLEAAANSAKGNERKINQVDSWSCGQSVSWLINDSEHTDNKQFIKKFTASQFHFEQRSVFHRSKYSRTSDWTVSRLDATKTAINRMARPTGVVSAASQPVARRYTINAASHRWNPCLISRSGN